MAEGRFLSANGLEIYFKESGLGKPLILLHGATDTHALWGRFVPELSTSFRVITPDSRGHGRTVNPSRGLSYRQLADDLAALITVLELEKPFIFGYSDGGQAALDLGIRYPSLPGALVLGGVWFKFSAQYQDGLVKAGFLGPGEIDFRIFEQFAPPDWRERMEKAHPRSQPGYPEILLQDLAELFWTPLNYTRNDFLKVSAPTLILMGEKDELVPVAEARELAGLIPGADFVSMPDATHSGVFQKEREVTGILVDFFSRHQD